ncbi:MAG TPA: L-ribulose-5-phosphate 4-epimerase AraD [Mycobacterium sp.]|nr:L-ribulose-5-phosphate 4-epimerase AraD [Mycobacterium sp.]
MDLADLRERVLDANRALAASGLVTLSFGNASGVDRASGVMVIKPSGVPYDILRPADMVAVALADGRVVDGSLRPSSDTPTHLVLYRAFEALGGIVHTHSTFAAAWAQAQRSIPCLGTTHADHFDGPVPVTRQLTAAEIAGDYEAATGDAIVETFAALRLEPMAMPAALVASHGPFAWGASATDAVTNAVALEAVATIAYQTLALAPNTADIASELRDRHFRRKHGPSAYYGQPGSRRADADRPNR